MLCDGLLSAVVREAGRKRGRAFFIANRAPHEQRTLKQALWYEKHPDSDRAALQGKA